MVVDARNAASTFRSRSSTSALDHRKDRCGYPWRRGAARSAEEAGSMRWCSRTSVCSVDSRLVNGPMDFDLYAPTSFRSCSSTIALDHRSGRCGYPVDRLARDRARHVRSHWS